MRAVAVIGVFLFHADIAWARGGYLGVDLFFVISGFLITHLLAAEIVTTGKLNLGAFYWRRAKRLLPASWLMTACVILAAWFLAPDALPRMRGDAPASLFYITNWELLSAKVSYFESVGRQPLLMHLWSLAIEEQFYILWAPLLLLCALLMGRAEAALLAAGLATLSVAWMGLLANRDGYLVSVTPTRLDFGTDTHSFPLLIGVMLGLIWRPERQRSAATASVNDRAFTLGLLALGVTLFLLSSLSEATRGLYPWGLLVSTLACAALVAAATFRGSFFGRWLDQQPMRWLGERSYGLYLWHWPIFMLTRPEDLHLDPSLILPLRCVLTLSIAALSYRFVETPIRHGLLERIGEGLRAPERRLASFGAGALVVAAAAAVCAPGVFVLTSGGAVASIRHAVSPAAAFPMAASTKSLERVANSGRGASDQNGRQSKDPQQRFDSIETRSAPSATRLFAGPDVTAIGDSVLLGSLGPFRTKLPGARVYAHVGWQARDVLETLRDPSRAPARTPVVVIHLGTNGFVYENQLRDILSMLADRQRVILVNAHVPRRWMEPNNTLIDRVARDYPNVVLVNWRGASEGHSAYFVADHFHLTGEGQRAFVTEIMRVGGLSLPGEPAPAAPAVLARASPVPNVATASR